MNPDDIKGSGDRALAAAAERAKQTAVRNIPVFDDLPVTDTANLRLGANLNPTQETEIDLLWMMLDAFRVNEMQEGLTAVYRGILFRAPEKAFSDELVLTTLQKAMEDISAADLRGAMRVLSASS